METVEYKDLNIMVKAVFSSILFACVLSSSIQTSYASDSIGSSQLSNYEQLSESKIDEKTIVLYRSIDKKNTRRNGDGVIFYKTILGIKITDSKDPKQNLDKILDDNLYIPQDYKFGGMSPTIYFNNKSNQAMVFAISKSNSNDYAMDGFSYRKLANGAWDKQAVFNQKNWGWFSYFDSDSNNNLILRSFSYAGYYNVTSQFENNQWQNGDFTGMQPKAAEDRLSRNNKFLLISRNSSDSVMVKEAKSIPVLIESKDLSKFEKAEFYGQQDNGRWLNGILIKKAYGIPYDIKCISNGSEVSRGTIRRFESCESYWSSVPNYCSVGNYQGQCKNGVPNGVGFKYTSSPDVRIVTGMFNNGKLNGYGDVFGRNGCGPAGCSGSTIDQQGWFEDDELTNTCNDLSDCLFKASGIRYTQFIKENQNQEIIAQANEFRKNGGFDNYLKAFQLSGDMNDYNKAKSLAGTQSQKSELELLAIRTAGYDKSFKLSAKVKANGKSVSTEDTQMLLELMRSVDSSQTISLDWEITNNKALALKQGPYKVNVTMGIIAKVDKKTCFIVCQTSTDSYPYTKTFDIEINQASKYRAKGTETFNVRSASNSVVFGMSSESSLSGVEPILRINSISAK